MTIYVSDAFAGAGSLASHTPDVDVVGGGWAHTVGAWSKQSGKAAPDATNWSGNRALIDAGSVPASLSGTASMEFASGTYRAFYISASADGSIGFMVAIHTTAGGRLRIIENNAIVRASIDVPLSSGVDYTLAATYEGGVITATIDGGGEITYSATLTQTHVGLFAPRPGDRFDDLLVTDGDVGGSIAPAASHYRRMMAGG